MSALQSSREAPRLFDLAAWTRKHRPPSRTKGKKVPAEILTDENVFRLFEVLHRDSSPRGLMRIAFITVMLRGLLRRAETFALYPKDLDLANFTIRVLHGKGDKCRVVGLDPKACVYVKDWMSARDEAGCTDNQPVFCSLTEQRFGNAIPRESLKSLFRTLRTKAGIKGRFYPHGLRHTGAVQMFREGAPLQVVQKQLGHTSLARTVIYLDHLHPGAVVNWCANRRWNDQNWNAAAAGSQKYVIIQESKGTTGFIVTLKPADPDNPDTYLRFPNEIVPKLEEATFFSDRHGAYAAVESLLPSIDFRAFHPIVQSVAKCGERSKK